jgi:hypothetical protein
MTFGLCGAPNTFQGAMNETLAPLWRKSVLVFLMTSWSIAEHWMIISFTWQKFKSISNIIQASEICRNSNNFDKNINSIPLFEFKHIL